MKFGSLVREGIKMNDLFYATEMLRFDKEMEYRSITGGLFSLAIIVAVLVGFANMIIDTLALNTINSVELISKDSSPTASTITLGNASNFMLAVELWGVNMSAPVRYFDVLMIQLSTSNGQREYNYSLIPLEACTRDHWAMFPEIVQDYERLAMSNWLCPPIGTTLQLNGDYTSNIYQYVNISVNPCIQFLNPYQPCASPDELAAVFRSRNDAIRFKIYYSNPLINSGQKNYKSYYLQSTNYISFGATIGGESYLYTSDYQITTDNSIWPYSQIQEDDGLLIEDKMEFHPFTTNMATYAAYFLVKSPTNYIYQREVQKISTVFSFIGGLVSAISAALFIFKAYNTLAFELTVAISIFKPPDDGEIDAAKLGFTFVTFFQYYIFLFFRKIGKPRQWPVVQYLEECREEIVNQLDVKALIKRIIFLQYCMTNLFEDYQLEGLQLQKPRRPSEIASIRQKIESLDTYEDHLFFGNSSKSSSEQQSQTGSHCSEKREKAGLFPLKMAAKQQPNVIKESEISIVDPYKLNSPGGSAFRIVSKNRVQPLDSINDEIQLQPEQIQKIKAKLDNRRISKQARASKTEERRSINLSFLKKNAEEGNPLSKKIWEQLQYYKAPHLKPKAES